MKKFTSIGIKHIDCPAKVTVMALPIVYERKELYDTRTLAQRSNLIKRREVELLPSTGGLIFYFDGDRKLLYIGWADVSIQRNVRLMFATNAKSKKMSPILHDLIQSGKVAYVGFLTNDPCNKYGRLFHARIVNTLAPKYKAATVAKVGTIANPAN